MIEALAIFAFILGGLALSFIVILIVAVLFGAPLKAVGIRRDKARARKLEGKRPPWAIYAFCALAWALAFGLLVVRGCGLG